MNNIQLDLLQQRVGHTFQNISLLEQALSHRSYSKKHNERLEFLGDSLVGMWVAEQLYKAFPDLPEGHLTPIRSSLVCKEGLSDIAIELQLGDALLLGEGTTKTGGHRLQSILADAYEALVAALYLDAGWETCRSIVNKHFEQRINAIESVESVRDAKSLLQEWLQARSIELPNYQLVDVNGPGHGKSFHVICSIADTDQTFSGSATNRRQAEQQAAASALEYIKSQ